ncbi:MAG: response regulator, partial [Pseudobacter sp.]|uniref:response regulator n=1 Tax=Pseudobacter sp. TaxID=2045420 RepID=UPI003F80AFF7
MKILIADDQAYIRNIVGKELRGQGHEVFTGTDGEQAIQLYEEHRPHLILVDHHMPLKTGLEVLTYIRLDKKDNIPAIIMSSNEEESVIVESFQIGVDDYIEKPVGIREVVARIQRLLTKTYGISSSPPATSSAVSPGDPLQSGRVLQKKYVGLVIPCYNEAKRLSGQVFTDFGYSNLGYHLCFVNDGSKDNTLEVLQQLREGHEDYISIYNMPVNAGKAEAVRQASLEMLKEPQLEYIGYLDADLSTDFNDYD